MQQIHRIFGQREPCVHYLADARSAILERMPLQLLLRHRYERSPERSTQFRYQYGRQPAFNLGVIKNHNTADKLPLQKTWRFALSEM